MTPPPTRASFPFPNSPPGSLPPPSPGQLVPDSDGLFATPPEKEPEGLTSLEDGDTDNASPLAARALTLDHHTASTTTGIELKFLTINVQKAGANNPSLVYIITIIDHHYPDFLLLTKTSMPPIAGPFAKLSAIEAAEYTILRPTLRSNRKAFQKPAF